MGYINQVLSQTKNLWVESFGTFLLVLVSTSALVTLNLSGQATSAAVMLVGVLSYAFIYGWLIFAFDGWQKGYFNPAVTLLCWLRGQITLTWLAAAVLVQLAGGLLASILVALLFGPMAVDIGLGSVHPMTSMGPVAAIVAEMLGTLFVLVTILKLNPDDSPAKRGLLVGSGLAIGQLFSIGISGAGLNPVRALAPQLVAADAGNWWIYIVGPLVASMVAWMAAAWLHQTEFINQPADNSHVSTTAPSQTKKPTPTASSTDESEALQHKAEQALEALRQTDPTPDSSPVPVQQMTSPPLQPSFKTEEDEQNDPVQSPAASSAPVRPAAVTFVDFDQPVETTQEE